MGTRTAPRGRNPDEGCRTAPTPSERASAVPCARRMRWDARGRAGQSYGGGVRRLARRAAAGRALGRRAGCTMGSPYAASPTVLSAAPRRLCPLLARRCTVGIFIPCKSEVWQAYKFLVPSRVRVPLSLFSLYRSFAPPSLALSCAMLLLARAVMLLPRLSVSSLGWAAVPLGGGPCPPSARVRGGIASDGRRAGGSLRGAQGPAWARGRRAPRGPMRLRPL